MEEGLRPVVLTRALPFAAAEGARWNAARPIRHPSRFARECVRRPDPPDLFLFGDSSR